MVESLAEVGQGEDRQFARVRSPKERIPMICTWCKRKWTLHAYFIAGFRNSDGRFWAVCDWCDPEDNPVLKEEGRSVTHEAGAVRVG